MRPSPPDPATTQAWHELWQQDEAAQTPRAPPSDSAVLRELFGTKTPRGAKAAPAQDADDWPRHNYNAAYESVAERQRRTRTPRRHRLGDRLEIWDVDEALPPEPAPTPTMEPPTPPAPRAAEERAAPTAPAATQNAMDPQAWLERVAKAAREPETTEAQVIRTLWGDPRRVTAPLFEASDVLHARPRAAAPTQRRVVVHVPATKRATRVRLRMLLVALMGLALGVTMGMAMVVLFT